MIKQKGEMTLPDLSYMGMDSQKMLYQLTSAELVKIALETQEGTLSDSGALVVNTGEFTGRSPKDRFIVRDELTGKTVWWGDVNIPFTEEHFNRLYTKVITYLKDKTVYVRDGAAGADSKYQLTLRVITEHAYQSLFAHNLFLRTGPQGDVPEWTIISAPGFKADPLADGTRQHNFSIINFTSKIILIGGTGYTGEIKKGIFSVLNYLLPGQDVLPMHCSANIGTNNDTAIFFGLSGTGKTTLSADPARRLIGDDEHGWSKTSIFNFEGGCYAKTAGLSPEREPEIFRAIRNGSLLENVKFFPGTNRVDFNNLEITENTRVSYPVEFIDNAVLPSVGNVPQNIFFLTADAFGVLPPVSRLNGGQAMYHFLSGYTAKIAGTEFGINEPQATFSACFGKAFLPLHPVKYADMLGKKLRQNKVKVWLVNTGWTGGSYGTGGRIKLSYTRAIINAALAGKLDNVSYTTHPVFGLEMPDHCPGVPAKLLDPSRSWQSRTLYDDTCAHLAGLFIENFKKYQGLADEETSMSGPKQKAVLV